MRTRAILIGMLSLAASLLSAPPAVANAQTPPDITVTTNLEPEEPRVGDRVRVTIEIDHASDRLITLVSGLARRPDLEVFATEPPTTTADGDRLRTRFAFTVQPFALGRIDFDQVVLMVLAEDGTASEFGLALPSLTVRSTIDPTKATLRPLKPQAEIAGGPAAWERPAQIAGAFASAAAVLLAGALVVRRRLRGRGAPLLEPLPDSTAEDAARRELDALRIADLLGQGHLDGFYGRLSSVVRGYLQQRYNFRATALTTHELERRMAADGLDRWQARLVSGLLERCDAAVYAHDYPPPASSDHDLTLAYEIIELARPRREPEGIPA
ncbi:MAG: hypothetical protein U0360_09270 [Dehalococcoidia bacterium]